jgi:predicted AAA+ superfamily ATPase
MFSRKLSLPSLGEETFFLWGPRQTGKTSLLRATYPNAYWIDLLKSEEFRRYLTRPETLREETQAQIRTECKAPFVVIDEIQKVPGLLDEVHWLHENLGVRFAMCGSSARKLKRGAANLLGGRAVRYELRGLVSAEVGREWDLVRMINHGTLPKIYLSERPERLLNAYVSDYLREEVAAEGLVRNLPSFSDFLSIAALSDSELVNLSNIARECGVSAPTVKGYFQILTDTLLGSWLPAFTRRPKRRVIGAPKFYFSDVAVVNYLARRGRLEPGTDLFSKAFENWCHHELRAFIAYTESFEDLYYWRLASGIEVDFIVGPMRVALEAKATSHVSADHLKGLRKLKEDHPTLERRFLVCLEPKRRLTSDGVEILPARLFAEHLWDGKIL